MLKRTQALLSRWFGRNARAAARQHQVAKRRKSFLEPLEGRNLLATFHVALTGNDLNDGNIGTPFRTIQAAITAASAASDGNDFVKVAAGTYSTPGTDLNFGVSNNVNIQNLSIQGGWDAVTFMSQTPQASIYIPQSVGSVNTYEVDVKNPNTTIDNFKFVFDGVEGTGGSRTSGGILLDGANGSTVSNNTFETGYGRLGSGARSVAVQTGNTTSSLNITIANNTILGNYVQDVDTAGQSYRALGIFLNPSSSSSVQVTGNTITGPFAAMIVSKELSNVTISGNTVTRTGAATGFQGIEVRNAGTGPFTNIVIANNTVDGGGTGAGIGLGDGGSQTLSGVSVTNNIVRNHSTGIYVAPGSGQVSGAVQYNQIQGNASNGFFRFPGTATLDLTKNWWDAISGPTTAANPGGLGQVINDTTGLTFSPWLIYGTDANPAAAGFQLPTTVVTTPGGDVSAADNAFRRLDNAIRSAASGQTIDILGTFDWTATNAAASYLASVANSDFNDIRGIEIPDAVNNLSITSSTSTGLIIGGGDASAYESFVFTDDNWSANGGGNAVGNTNLTIEKLKIEDFESAVMIGWNATGSYPGTKIRNNQVILAGDDSDTQNIAFYMSYGLNQQLTGNAVTFQGDGTRVVGTGARSFGFQNNTSGGALYDNLLIDGNTFQVGASSTGETIYGIWENGHNDDNSADIAITNNQFLGRSGDLLDRALMLSSQSTGLVVDGNSFTDVDNVYFMNDNGGPSSGDTFRFTNNTLIRVGGADGVFLTNASTGPTPINFQWNINNNVDGFTGVRGLNELSSQATGSSRPTGAATQLNNVTGVGPLTSVYVDDNWGTPNRFTNPIGIGASTQPVAFGFNTQNSIAAGIAAVDAGGNVFIRSGSYAESLDTSTKSVNINPGNSPGQVAVNGIALDSNDTLTLELNGTNPLTQFDNFLVTGGVSLGNANLALQINQFPAGGVFRIIDNDGGDAVTGTFAGLANLSTFFVSGIPVTINYGGGDGNDVVLTIATPTQTWVNDNWVITTDASPAGLSTGDTVANTGAGDNGTVTGKTFGYNAFSTVQQGVTAVQTGGTVFILHNNTGSYNEDVTINKAVTLTGDTVTLGALNKFILASGENVASSTGITAPTVDVQAGAKINDGIVVVAVGGTVYVGAGTFNEDVVFNKGLTLSGPNVGVAGTGVRGTEAVITGNSLVTSPAAAVIINGMKFANVATGGSTLWLQTAVGHVVTNSVFESSVAGGGSGDRAINLNAFGPGTSFTITNNLIAGNGTFTATDKYGTAAWDRGIYSAGQDATAVISNNRLENVRTGIALDDFSNGVATVNGNTIIHAGTGLALSEAPPFLGRIGSLTSITNNTFDNADTDFNLRNLTGNPAFNLMATGNAAASGQALLFLGGSGDETIVGTGGIDVLIGDNHPTLGALNDSNTFTGGVGDDYVRGAFENGIDRALYSATLSLASFTPSSITLPGFGTNPGWLVATGGAEGTDSLVEVEIVDGAEAGRFLLVGNGGFATIQAAVNAAVNGDTIVIQSGTYVENVSIGVNVTLAPLSGVSILPASGNALTITAGTTRVIGTLTTGTFGTVVQTGSTLGGSGNISGPVNINAGAFADPGFSPGIFASGNYTQSGTLNIEILRPAATQVAGVDFDQWQVTGTVTLGGPLNLVFTGSGSIANLTSFKIIDNDGTADPVSGVFTGLANGATFNANGQNWAIYYNGGDGNDVVIVTVPFLAPTVTYAEDLAWAGYVNGQFILDADFTTAGDQSAIYGYNAFSTIQAAVNAVAASGTVMVNAGTYVEGLSIPKALTLLGPNAGIDPNTGVRGAEAIVLPAVSNPDPFSPTSSTIIYVATSNVTIDGILVDGDNPALAGGVTQNGANVDAIEAISSYEGVGNINVRNNVVRNLSYAGLDFYNFVSDNATTNNTIQHNKFDNIGYLPYGYGMGVLVYNNFYAAITDNVMTGVRLGVQTGNYSKANPNGLFTPTISDNSISATRVGIYHNLAYSNASTFTISDNQISLVNEPGSTRANGIFVSSLQGTVGVNLSDNTITSVATAYPTAGYRFWNTPTTSPLVIDGGSISGTKNGVWIDNHDGGNGNGASSAVTVDGVTINSSDAGVYVLDNPLNTNGATSSAIVQGNTTIIGAAAGVLVQGSDASATVQNNLASIHGNVIGIDVNGGSATITANSIYDNGTGIRFTSGGSGSVTNNDFDDAIDNGIDLQLTATAGAVALGANNQFAGNTFFIDVQSTQSFNLVGNGTTFDEANNFRIEDKMHHRVDTDLAATVGLVTWVTGNLYVTSAGTDHSVQRGVDAASSGNTINVEAGSYVGTVAISGKNNLTLLGAGNNIVTGSVLSGPNTSPPNTATLSLANTTGTMIDGFVITREGNNTTDWAANGMTYGVLFNTGASNNTLQNSLVTGNRSGIDLRNTASGNTIKNNRIDFNRTGILVNDLVSNNAFQENFITNNWTAGILFLDTTTPATGNTFTSNNISGNWYTQVEDRRATGAARDLSGNWFGTTTIATTSALAGEPGYAALIPTTYGGGSSPPATPLIISGPGHANIDFTPYLASNTDLDANPNNGFQGDFANLYVSSAGAQVQSGGRINEGVARLTSPGTLRVLTGTYAENVLTAGKTVTLAPGASPGQVTINGDLTLDANDTLAMEVNGTNPVTQYDNFIVNGIVTLGGAALSITGSYVPAAADAFTLIANDLADSVSGTFNGLPAGTLVNVNGTPKRIFYTGNDGNDVVLASETPTISYVSNTLWAGYVNGQFILDADAGTTGDQSAIFNYNAFATIAAAQAATTTSGTIIVNAGSYAVAVVGSGTQTIEITGPNLQQNSTFNSLATVAGQNVVIEGSSILTIGDATSTTIASVISGGGSLVKQGAGTLTLTNANSYTGTTTINQGTLALSGGNNRLPTGNDIVYGVTSTLDVGSTSQTIRNLVFNSTATGTTTITGSGALISNANQSLVIGGSANGITRTVNMSGLASFTFSSSANQFNVGGTNNNTTTSTGVLQLATNSSITASIFGVGHFSTGSNFVNSGTVRLGQTTTINATTILVGGDKTTATLNFQPGVTNPSLTIRGTTGGSSTANVTIATSGSGQQPAVGTVDLTTGVTGTSTIDALLGTVLIGINTRNTTNARNSTGTFQIGGGSVSANSIVLSRTTAGGTPASGDVATGTLSIGGATVTATTITMADRGGAVGSTANLQLTSGTLNADTIQRGSSAGGGGTINFTWVDGTISNQTGLNQSVNGVTPVNGLTGGLTIALSNTGNVSGTHTWNVSGSNSANVDSNVSLSSVGSLTKVGTGTLSLGGVNSYSGPTTVNAGTLLVNGTNSGVGAVNVNNSAILGGTGSIAGVVILNNTSRLAAGGSPESLATGSLSFASGAFFDVEIGGTAPVTQHDQVNVTGTVSLNDATLNLLQISGFNVDSGAAQQFVIIANDDSEPVSGIFNGLPEGSPISYAGGTLYVTYSGNDGNDVVLYSQPTVNGTANADTLVLRQFNGTQNEYSLNGAAFVQVTNTLPFVFNGLAETDLMLVDTSNGDPIPTGNAAFNGELLRVQKNGGVASDVLTYIPSTTAGNGTVSHATFGSVLFTGTSNVDFVNVTTVNVQTATLVDTLTLADGNTATNSGTVDGAYSITPAAALTVTGAHAIVGLRNVTNANINTVTGGGDGNDGVTINTATGAHGVANLAIATGTNTDTVTVTGALTVSGNVNISSQNIGVNNTLTGGGTSTVTLNAGGGAITTSGTGIDVIAQDLAASATTGINLDTTVLNITATSSGTGAVTIDETNGANLLNVSAGTGLAAVTSATGNLHVTTVSASTSVTLTATAGSITDANGGTSNINAASLTASSQTGIDLDTTVTTLTSASVTGIGAIDISDTAGGLVVTSATTNDGPITLNATGGILTLATVTAGGTANIIATTTTSGNILVGNVTATSDTITVTAVGSIEESGSDLGSDISANILVLTAGTGIGGLAQIEINGNTPIGAGLTASVTGTGPINVRDTNGLRVNSAITNNGSITIEAEDGVLTLTTVTAGGAGANIIANTLAGTGTIAVGAVTAAGDTVTLSAFTNITDDNAAAVNIVAATLNMTAATGIGAGNALETTVDTLSATNATSGNIEIAETDAITLASVVQSTDLNDIIVTAGGTITVGVVNAGTTNGDVTLTATVGSIIDNANDTVVDITGDVVTLTAASGVGESASFGSLDTTANSLDVSVTAAGLINLAETNAVTLTDVDTQNGSITITAAGTITASDVASTTDAEANDISLTATTGNIIVGVITAGTTNGDVTLLATTGTITDNVNDSVADVIGGVVTMTAASAVGESAGFGSLDTTANTLDVSVTSAGSIFINETNVVTLFDVDTQNGSITITAAGTITATDVASLTDATNVVTLTTTTGNILVNLVTAGGDTVVLSSAGSIDEATPTDGTADVIADVLTMTAVSGIGGGGTIEINTVTTASRGLTASVTSAGPIDLLDTTGGLRILSATTANGPITIAATTGDIIAQSVTSTTDANANDITLTALLGSINVGTVNAGATNGDVFLTASAAITDLDATNPDIIADDVVLLAGTGVGTSVDPLETGASNLESSGGTGGVFVANTGSLTIGGILIGVDGLSATGGDIVVTTTGTMTVTENVTATGAGTSITLHAIDDVASGQNFLLNAGITISSALDSVTLNAGDNATISGNVSSGTITTINVDFGDAESGGATAAVGDGGMLAITGSITTPNTAAGGAFLNGGNDYDTFTFNPQTTTAFYVDGDLPLGGVVGDILQINVASTSTPNLTVPGNATVFNGKSYDGLGSGRWTFDPNHREVRFKSIEDQQVTGPYHLTYDNSIVPVGNLVIMLDGTANPNEQLQFRNGSVAGPVLYELALAPILSVRVLGGVGADVVTIDDINGLPSFADAVPAITGVGNNTFIGDTDGTPLPEFFFDAGSGINTLNLNLNSASTLQQWAIGTGTGAAGSNEGELQSTNASTGLNAYVRNVNEVNRTGLGGTPGGLTVFGDDLNNTINIADNTGGETRVSAAGYPSFDFSGNNYSSFVVNAQAGIDTIDLLSFGSNQDNDWPITLNGNTGNDTIRVRSTSSNTGLVTLNGNQGSDHFQLYDGTLTAGTVDNIAGLVVVDGTDGEVANFTDTLTIIDNGDTSFDNVLISAVNPTVNADYAVEGINGLTGNDVTFRNVDTLNYTGTQGNDFIDGRFVNTTPTQHDLNIVSLSGWTGADQFYLFTSDQKGGTGVGFTPTNVASGVGMISLYGDTPGNLNANDGNDIFGETPAGIIGTGVMNVGLVVSSYTRMIRPSASTGLFIDGGEPSGLFPPMGDQTGDRLNLDITALPNTDPVIVSTFMPGTVVATGIASTTWTQIEDMNLVDQNKLTNVQMGDLFARTTPGQDLIQLALNPTPANPSQVRLRINSTIANYSASNKTIVYSGGMNDTITQANLTIPAEFYGEDGNDNISGGISNDWLVGGLGNDRINGSRGDNVIWGDNSPTLPTDPQPQDLEEGGNDILSGLDGADVFYGGGGDDQVSAGGGNDYAYGGQGHDLLDGHDGDDRLYGGLGNDLLSGFAGNDLLVGNAGDDKLYGQEGNDVLFGGTGADLIDGGTGDDLLVSGRVGIEDSSWTALASTGTYSAATYTRPSDNDFALITLLAQWGTFGNRGTLGTVPSITHDGANDDLFGGLGDDDFCWEFADVIDNPPGISPPDFNAIAQGTDVRFGPT